MNNDQDQNNETINNNSSSTNPTNQTSSTMQAQNEYKSTIVDLPLEADQKDQLNIEDYQDGLINYIKRSDTPVTISLQGEWGSGKTSLMHVLKNRLCEGDNAQYYGIWINTWQFSLKNSPEQAVAGILASMIAQVSLINPNKELLKKLLELVITITKVAGPDLAKLVNITSDITLDPVYKKIFTKIKDAICSHLHKKDTQKPEYYESNIKQLKNSIKKLVDDTIKVKPKRGFIFFIDDLDRIKPALAVDILDIIKNIFDLHYCIFILAIDHNVIVKGLTPKLGEMTLQNEHEFNSYFDKLIQLPFTMPVSFYSIQDFLRKSFEDMSLFSADELDERPANKKNGLRLIDDICFVTRLSVGQNPRTLRKITNMLSLALCINRTKEEKEIAKKQKKLKSPTAIPELIVVNRFLVYIMLCIQIAYPELYNLMSINPNFNKWNHSLADYLNAPQISNATLQQNAEILDQEWKQATYRYCQMHINLKNRAFDIIRLLNKINEMLSDGPIVAVLSYAMSLLIVTKTNSKINNQ